MSGLGAAADGSGNLINGSGARSLRQARVRRAEGITVPAKKFGIEAVRRDCNDNEHEGLADSLNTLLQNIETN